MQVVLVYLLYISAKIHSKCTLQPKIAKTSFSRASVLAIFEGFHFTR